MQIRDASTGDQPTSTLVFGYWLHKPSPSFTADFDAAANSCLWCQRHGVVPRWRAAIILGRRHQELDARMTPSRRENVAVSLCTMPLSSAIGMPEGISLVAIPGMTELGESTAQFTSGVGCRRGYIHGL